MKILIEKDKLRLLLEQKRDYIGNRIEGIGELFAGLSFAIPIFCAEYNDIWIISGSMIQTLCVLLGLGFSVMGAYMMIKNLTDRYSQEELYKDIVDLSEIQHRHSIVAIRDSFHKNAIRFLVYYDERWKCRLFVNYKTTDNDIESIKNSLANDLEVKKDSITLELRTEAIQKKYSVSHQEERVYDHLVYFANVAGWSGKQKQNNFEMAGRKYYWMTISEMEADDRIREVNQDVVNLVKSVIA